MTAKTIDLDRSKYMTAFTEAVLAQDTMCHRVGMAVDAVLKAVPGGAKTIVHGLITLMQNHLHVITAHLFGRLHAFAFFIYLHRRPNWLGRYICRVRGKRRGASKQHPHQQNE